MAGEEKPATNQTQSDPALKCNNCNKNLLLKDWTFTGTRYSELKNDSTKVQ